MIKPSKSVLIGGAAFVLAAAVLFTYTFLAAARHRDQPEPRPTLHASVGTTLVDVAPLGYCTDVMTGQCDPAGAPSKLPVRPGAAIVVSLPEYITARPWSLTVERIDVATGLSIVEVTTHLQPARATLILKSTDKTLLGTVEIKVADAAQDQFGNLVTQAIWSINTLDRDYTPAG